MIKIIIKLIVLLFIISLTPAITYAQSIFIKDGSIIDGWVIKESEKTSTIKMQTGKIMELPKKDILRIIFDADYKNKTYLYKIDGDLIECFIVNEDRDSYTYRTDLSSAKETVIKKSKVNLISKQKLAEIKDKTKKEKTVLFDRFMHFKLGYNSIYSYSTTNSGVYIPGFEIGYGFYDKVVEFEMSISMDFYKKASPGMLIRFNTNFVFANVIGFGLGFFTTSKKHETELTYPMIEYNAQGILYGPVFRIPNRLHVSLLLLLPLGNELNYKTKYNGDSYQYSSLNNPFNFNLILAADLFVWKSLSIGLSYILTGGEYLLTGNPGTIPQYSSVLFYSHQIIVSVGYGFHP